ncbi:cupin domain-containing protein [Deinococcus aestuarii]|uniref:cupin domain-containing protein n=1 Tax=Deinococcus aestuarii TaxID=2774531 RepID=UPI001C0BF4BB|nr:cupin domain-containing protein [Deinococcus aestuarii]
MTSSPNTRPAEDLGAMTGNVVRFADLKPRAVPLMFIDSIIPGHQRHNYAIIGDTASENDAYAPLITTPHGFQIGMVRARQGNGPAYHTHDYIESFLPLRGRWRFYWGEHEDRVDGETILGEFDYVTLPPRLWRGFEAVDEGESWIFAVLEKHEVYGGKDPYWAPEVIRKAREHGFEADERGKMIKPGNFAELEGQMRRQFGDE